MTVGVVFACFLLFNLWNDHSRLANIYRLPPSGPQAETIWKGQVDTLLELHKESLFSPLINGMLIVTADINEEAVEKKLRVCNDAMHYSPTPRIIFKCASLMMIAGRVDDGLALAAMGRRSFPKEATLAGAELQSLSVRFPVLLPLRDLLAPIPSPTTATSDQ